MLSCSSLKGDSDRAYQSTSVPLVYLDKELALSTYSLQSTTSYEESSLHTQEDLEASTEISTKEVTQETMTYLFDPGSITLRNLKDETVSIGSDSGYSDPPTDEFSRDTKSPESSIDWRHSSMSNIDETEKETSCNINEVVPNVVIINGNEQESETVRQSAI